MTRKPKRGDLVLVTWEDHAGGDGDEPDCPVFCTPGWFVEWTTKNGVKGLHLARTKTVAAKHDYTGEWDFYVKSAVRGVEVCGIFK